MVKRGTMHRDTWSGHFLFHGTRSIEAILAEDRLRAAGPVDSVSFTRSFNTAVYWARLPRDDQVCDGAVLVLDGEKLRRKTQSFIDLGCDGEDEHEELHWGDVAPLSSVLVATVPVPAKYSLGRLSGVRRAKLLTFAVGRDERPVLALQDSRERRFRVDLREKQARELIVALAQSLAR